MNNELIERIETQIKSAESDIGLIGMHFGAGATKDAEEFISLMQDCKAALSEPVASSQDVEEFIAANVMWADNIGDEVTNVSDLREWMAGHARVPVEPTHEMCLAGNEILPSCVNSVYVYKAMLTASKERTE